MVDVTPKVNLKSQIFLLEHNYSYNSITCTCRFIAVLKLFPSIQTAWCLASYRAICLCGMIIMLLDYLSFVDGFIPTNINLSVSDTPSHYIAELDMLLA